MSDRMFVATRKGLFRMDRGAGAGSWSITGSSFLGDHVSIVLPDPASGAVFAALRLGHFGCKLRRSDDAGESWEEIAVPVYPEKPEGVEDEDPVQRAPIPWSLDQIWCLERGGPDQPGRLWAGTIPGGLFRSDDDGASWELVRSLWDHPLRKQWFGGGADHPGIHSICVDPRDSRRVTLGVSCGGVWVTTDDGATWSCRATGMFADYMPPEQKDNPAIQDPHRIVQCQAAPDVLWAQHHNGVFRSTNGSETWTEIDAVEPSVFGFAVAVHPADGDTAWFVPAVQDQKRIPVDGRVVVARTRDGGESFSVLRDGLPQDHAYDLTFRHALDIDGSGDRLAFGSTTGSLWSTDDQGDHWHCVNANLPPIYAVRFDR